MTRPTRDPHSGTTAAIAAIDQHRGRLGSGMVRTFRILKDRMAEWLLGPILRAARMTEDAESRLVAIGRAKPSRCHFAHVMIGRSNPAADG